MHDVYAPRLVLDISKNDMNRLPSVDVLVPSFNQGRFLSSLLENLFSQKDFVNQILIQDNLSSDCTSSVVSRFAESMNIHFNSAADSGQSDALNRVMRRVSADITAWQNADDLYSADALGTVVHLFSERPDIDYVYGNIALIDETGAALKKVLYGPIGTHGILVTKASMPTQALFWRSRLNNRLCFDENLQYCMDVDLFCQLSQLGRGMHINKILGAMRIHAHSKTSLIADQRHDLERSAIAAKYCTDLKSLTVQVKKYWTFAGKAAYLMSKGETSYVFLEIKQKLFGDPETFARGFGVRVDPQAHLL